MRTKDDQVSTKLACPFDDRGRDVLRLQVRDGGVPDETLVRRSAAADWLGRYADALRAQEPAPSPPDALEIDRLPCFAT